MHVECLKAWLQRQNACPLCKGLHIAQSRYEPITNHRGDELSNTRRTEGSSINQDPIHPTGEDDVDVQDIEAMTEFVGITIHEDDNECGLMDTVSQSNDDTVANDDDNDNDDGISLQMGGDNNLDGDLSTTIP